MKSSKLNIASLHVFVLSLSFAFSLASQSQTQSQTQADTTELAADSLANGHLVQTGEINSAIGSIVRIFGEATGTESGSDTKTDVNRLAAGCCMQPNGSLVPLVLSVINNAANLSSKTDINTGKSACDTRAFLTVIDTDLVKANSTWRKQISLPIALNINDRGLTSLAKHCLLGSSNQKR